jgi:hypothetical protein
MLHKTFITLAAAVALCVPVATNALADAHPGVHGGKHPAGGHAMVGPARSGRAMGHARGGHVVRYGGGYRSGPIYDSCVGYGDGYAGCPSHGVPLVGGVVNGILGGYGPY